MSSQDIASSFFSFQAFEKLLQTVPECSATKQLSMSSEPAGDLNVAMEKMALGHASNSASRLFSFLVDCSKTEFLLEGVLAVSVARVDGPFWGPLPVTFGSDSSAQSAVAAVSRECVQVLRDAGASSEQTALSIAALGRKISGAVGLKLPKDFQLRSVLQNVPGVVLCGESQSRSGACVYYDTSAAPTEDPQALDADFGENLVGAIDHLRESNDLAAAVCALLCLWYVSPKTQTEFHKTCRQFSLNPKACMDALQHSNHLIRALLTSEKMRLPETLFSSVIASQLPPVDASVPFAFLPVEQRQDLLSRAAACARTGSAAASAISNIAISNFSDQIFEIFSAFGDTKCRILLPDGSSLPCNLPLKPSLSSGQSCLGNYMGAAASAAEGCMSILCATSNPLLVNPCLPLRSEIVCGSALAIDKLHAASGLPSHPACIISRTSRMEISVHGPDDSVQAACDSIKAAISNASAALLAVPLVLGDDIGLIAANHRAIFGAGFRAMSIVSPEEFNGIDISNVGQYLSAVSGKSHFQKSGGCSLADLKAAFEVMCLQKIFPHPHNPEDHPFAVDAKTWGGHPIISVSFSSASAASAACKLILQLPHSSFLHITSAVSAVAKSDADSALRVAFAVSQIKSGGNEVETPFVKQATVAGIKYYAVNMKCCNRSAWHADETVPDPSRPPVQIRLEDFRIPPGDRNHRGRLRYNYAQYEKATSDEQRHKIARDSAKSAFTTHRASRRALVQRSAFNEFAARTQFAGERLSIPSQVFAHSGHKCLDSEKSRCPFLDGPHRRTFDDIPRWSCCDAPCVDHEGDLFCNAKPREPFDSFAPADLCRYCWETHYYLDARDAHEASLSAASREYQKMVDAFDKKQAAPRALDWDNSGLDPGALLENRYCLWFLDDQRASDAIKIITHQRQLDFSLATSGVTFGSHDQCNFSFASVKHDRNRVTFNLNCEITTEGQPKVVRKRNVPLPNRHLLIGLLRHWGCAGVVALDTVKEANTAPNADKFLSGIIRAATHEIEQTLIHQGVPQAAFKITCDPTFVVPHPSCTTAKSSVHSFAGLYGNQMLSFVVQMQSQESRRAALSGFHNQMQGISKSLSCEGMRYNMVCCGSHPDTSRFVLLPADAPQSFIDCLKRTLEEIVLKLHVHAPNSILSWSCGAPNSLAGVSGEGQRQRLVLESSDEGLVDHALSLLGYYVNGTRLVPDSSLVWWFHSEQGSMILSSLRSSCASSGVCMVVLSSSTVAFYGDYDSCKRMQAMLQNKLSELQSETQYSKVAINITLPQLNRFIKRYGSLKGALQTFSPHVQTMRATQTEGKWQLIVTASPEGAKYVADDALVVAQAAVEPSSRGLRYECPICFECSDTLNDDWLVSLACGCILHVPCARLCYGCDEEDPLDPLKPRRLPPLDCFALNSEGKKCRKQLAQLDIRELVPDPEQLQRRVTEELARFASIPCSGWRMCPVPTQTIKCQMMYRTVPSTQCWGSRKCEGCGFEHCASCEGAPHEHGMSCKEAIGDTLVSKDLLEGLDSSRCANTISLFSRSFLTR
jgi:hypothetical protein